MMMMMNVQVADTTPKGKTDVIIIVGIGRSL